MVKIRNASKFGDLDVSLLGRTVVFGEVVDVSAEHASRLLAQVDVWKPAGAPRAPRRAKAPARSKRPTPTAASSASTATSSSEGK